MSYELELSEVERICGFVSDYFMGKGVVRNL